MTPTLAWIIPVTPPGGGERPEHPIYHPPGIWGPPTMPPGYWGGGMGPGVKPQPPSGPVDPGFGNPAFDPRPEHPIYNPPGIWGPPSMPPGFWGGGMGPGVKPQPPQPPQNPGEPPTEVPEDGIWVQAYVPQYQCWTWAYIEPPQNPQQK